MTRSPEAEVTGPDLTPMVDLIFLLIVFFLLAGRIATEIRAETISVPPGLSGVDIEVPPPDWMRCILEVGGDPRLALRLRFNGGETWCLDGRHDGQVMSSLRERLDQTYGAAQDNAARDGLQLKKLILEIRADGAVPHGMVQRLVQVAVDGIDPMDGAPRRPRHPIVDIEFGIRDPDGEF